MDQGQHRLDPLLLDTPPRRRNPRLKEEPIIPDHDAITDFSDWILWPGIVYRKETHLKHPNPKRMEVFTNISGKKLHIGKAAHSTLWNKQRKRHTSQYFLYLHYPTLKYHKIRIDELYICQIRPYPGTDYILISQSITEGNAGSIQRQIMFPENKGWRDIATEILECMDVVTLDPTRRIHNFDKRYMKRIFELDLRDILRVRYYLS